MKNTKKIFFALLFLMSIFSASHVLAEDTVNFNKQPSFVNPDKKPDVIKEAEKNTQDLQKKAGEIEGDTFYKPKEDKQGGIILSGKKYPLETYKGYSQTGDLNIVGKGIIGIGNAFFSLTKLIYSGIDEGVNTLSSKQIINEQAKKVSDISSSLWSSLSSAYGITFIAIAFITAFYILSIKGSAQEAFTIVFKTCLVFVLASVWVAKADFFLKTTDSLANTLQSTILSAGSTFQSDYQEIPAGEETEGTVAIMRNTLFKATVYRPYLLMNYGTVDEDEINSSDSKRIDSLLVIKKNGKNSKKIQDIVKKEAKENSFMDEEGEGVYSKLGIGMMSLFAVIAIGLPFLIISIANLIVQFFILAVVLILPFAFLFSLLPRYPGAGYKLLEKLIMLFLQKSFISLFVLFFILVISVVDTTIPLVRTDPNVAITNPVGKYILNTIVLSAVLSTLLSKRDKVIELVTGGMVRVDSGDNGARRGIAGVAAGAYGGYKIGRFSKDKIKDAGNFSKNSYRGAKGLATKSLGKWSDKRNLNGNSNSKGNTNSPQNNNMGGKLSDKRNLKSSRPQNNSTESNLSDKRNMPTSRPQNNNTEGKLSDKRNLYSNNNSKSSQSNTDTGGKLSEKRNLRSNSSQNNNTGGKLSDKRNLSSNSKPSRPKNSNTEGKLSKLRELPRNRPKE